MKKVFIKTLGCKVNRFDSDALESQFENKGYLVVGTQQEAEITVINSCSVTANAEKEARYLLRRYSRENPGVFQVVTGCYAQIDSAAISRLEHVDYVVPNEAKHRLIELLERRLKDPSSEERFPKDYGLVEANRQSHFKSAVTFYDKPRSSQTRTFLKIQDGCNGFCSYCQIPYARGESRSVPAEAVLSQVTRLAEEGAAELVLTGIHLGDYEDIEEGVNFSSLLERIFTETKIPRLRISSLEPSEVSRPMLEVLKKYASRFCPHFHLPLQSGSDRILKRMRRTYDCAAYRNRVDLIREFFPWAQLTADILPGFPQEEQEDFEETVRFIKDCQLAGLHVFPYSKRPNTAAERLPGHLDGEVIRRRVQQLRDLSQKLQKTYAESQFGSVDEVLWETFDQEHGYLRGKTTHYLPAVRSLRMDEASQNFLGRVESVSLLGFGTGESVLCVKA